jgi:hypothetical protein
VIQLRIKLHQPYARGYIQAGAVASVRWLSDVTGRRVKSSWRQEKAVDIAGEDIRLGDFSAFTLPGAGYYSVDVTPPRGKDISREFLIRDGEVRTETITMEASPHEYLAWQQYAGIVPPHLGAEKKVREERKLLFRGDRKIESGQETEPLFLEPAPVPNIVVADLPANGSSWAGISRWRRLFPPGAGLNHTPPRVDQEFVAWFPFIPNVNQAMELIARLQQVDPLLNPEFPRWLAFESYDLAGFRVDVASTPWPWWGAERQGDEQLQFVYDRVRPSPVDRKAPGRLTISIQDRRWFGLLQFLASGRLSQAREVSEKVLNDEDPRAALEGKLKGPLCAVAGGIILVTQAQSSEPQEWDNWLENLSNWFPGIPDGAILLGYRRLQQARKAEDVKAVYVILRMAMGRGIPFFSASIQMLGLALAQISGEIPEADDLRRAMSPISTRVDPEQPFTVIRWRP